MVRPPARNSGRTAWQACDAVVIAGDSSAIDDARARAQACQRLNDQREATGQVVARTTVEPHLRASLAGNNAEAIVLDLMQPLAAGRQLIGFSWQAGRDEPGWQDTLQHAGQIKLCNSDCNQNRAVIWSFRQLVTTPASQSAW